MTSTPKGARHNTPGPWAWVAGAQPRQLLILLADYSLERGCQVELPSPRLIWHAIQRG